MAETIFLLNNEGELVEMTETGHLTEDDFQKLLADYPNLISGDQINKDDPRRWLLISREMGVSDSLSSANRWSLDHLFIDQDAIPTLVEVKRGTDTRLRREVIGQILDYAANAVSYWSIEEIISMFEKTCQSKGVNPADVLNNFLIESYFKDKFWETVQTNLKEGKIRLLLVADIIPKEMRRIIEFLNEQMGSCEILGVEIKQFVGQNLRTLVPRVIGATMKAHDQKAVKSSVRNQWNEERFFEEILIKKDAIYYDTYRELYNRSLFLFDDIWWGFGNKIGSFVPHLKIDGLFIQLFGVYTYGGIDVQFQFFKTKKPFDDESMRKDLQTRINNALQTNVDSIDKRPAIKIEYFTKPGVLDAFFEVVKWYIETVKRHYGVESIIRP